jgi:hypothetical protein
MSEQCCKEESVSTPGTFRFHRCYNKAKKDGYCMVHHPETKARRDKAREERWKAQQANSIYARYERAMDRIATLEANIVRDHILYGAWKEELKVLRPLQLVVDDLVSENKWLKKQATKEKPPTSEGDS